MQTDLTNILEPAINTSTIINTSSTQTTVIVENISNVPSFNESGENATINTTQETVQEQTEILEISDNKFTINSIDENEIIKQIEQKTKLDKDKIKRAIKFKKKEPVKDDKEELEEPEITTSITQLGYISKVNGSVIIRLG